jgi:hypothetical protein
MSDERFRVRLEGTRPIRLTVAEMTPEDVRLAVAFAERELQLMQETAAPAMALLQRAADGDQSMPRWELRRARETVATLVRMQQQTDRLREAVLAVVPAAARRDADVLACCRLSGRRAPRCRLGAERAAGGGLPH